MTEFKVGDKVVAYDGYHRQVGIVRRTPDDEKDTMGIEIGGKVRAYHPKQCRKLKTKKKIVIWIPREEYPVHVDHTGSRGLLEYLKEAPAANFKHMYTRIEYTEHKNKK